MEEVEVGGKGVERGWNEGGAGYKKVERMR